MSARKAVRRNGQKGFTLIELMAVVAILGILAVLALPRIGDAVAKAKATRGTADLKVLATALDQYLWDKSEFPLTLTELKKAGYLKHNTDFNNGYGHPLMYAVSIESGKAVHYLLADPGNIPNATAQVDATSTGNDGIPSGNADGKAFIYNGTMSGYSSMGLKCSAGTNAACLDAGATSLRGFWVNNSHIVVD